METMVMNITQNKPKLDLACPECKKIREYTLKRNAIPTRPKTQCSCGKWLYLSKVQVTDLQEQLDQLTNNDQRPIKPKSLNTQSKSQTSKKTKKGSQRPNQLVKSDQLTNEKIKIDQDQAFFQYIRTISGDLVIALNYAINTIKNKPEVKAKKNGATRYDYFKNWNQYRDFFKRIDREMKIKIGIINEVEMKNVIFNE